MNERLNFTTLSIFIVISIGLAVLAFSFGGVDFSVYYAAARVTMQGGNPYDYSQLAPQIISSAGKLNNPYYYAPWFTWSVIPFALLPFDIARAAWAVTHFVLWVFALWNLSKTIDYPPAGWTKWGMWLMVTAVFAWSTWGSEQVGVLVFFLFTLILLNVSRENWGVVGVLLAVILFKPNITAIPAGLIALWVLLHKKTWKPIAVMSLTLVLLTILSLIISPQWYIALFDTDKLQGLSYTLNATGETDIQRFSTTLKDFFAAYGIEGYSFVIVQIMALLAGLICVGWGLYVSTSLVEFTSIVILVNFALVPYALFYDYPPLIIPLFYGHALLFRDMRYRWFRYTVNALIIGSLFVGDGIPYRYWITVILAIFLFFGFYITKKVGLKSGL